MYVFPKKVTLLITAKQKVQYDLQHRCVTPQLSLLLFCFVTFHYMTTWNLMRHSFSLKVLVQSMKKRQRKKKWLQRYRAKHIKQQLYGKYYKRFASKNDQSKWPARWEFDQSSPRSGWTLSVDRPLFWAQYGDFQVNIECFFCFFLGPSWLNMVWFERSLHSAQGKWPSFPWPSKPMTSQAVQGPWICTGSFMHFWGEWMNALLILVTQVDTWPIKREG